MPDRYVMTVSRTTIDKLGVTLYDTAADAVGEMISNSYDADAENVIVKIPLGGYLATKKSDGTINDRGYEITVEDDGHGMSPQDVNDFFLSVGLERRGDEKRKKPNVIGTKNEMAGTLSLEKRRPVTGRKGIGKLAPFGICREIEIWSAGGRKTDEKFPIANLVLEYDEINGPSDERYEPKLGPDDGKFSKKRGTKITLRRFLQRKTPDSEVFLRQLARKFSLGTPDFKIRVSDSETNESGEVSPMDLPILENTRIDLGSESISSTDGQPLPIRGWVAYSKTPYKNAEMAGVRIYARGKLTTVTRDFGRKAGFTGEHTIRSYMVGEIHADWLDADDDEDLIASDRQDILWSSEKGQALQEWGQALLQKLGSQSVGPLNQRAYEIFLNKSDFQRSARDLFGNSAVYDSAMGVGKVIGRMVSMHNVQDAEYVNRIKELAFMLAPHKMMVEELQKISKGKRPSSLDLLETLFANTRLAEASSLGQVANERINAITKLDGIIHEVPNPPEKKLQKILEATPWLIHAEWTILQANYTLAQFRESFETWYEKETGKKITTTSFDAGAGRKRPDFIMLSAGRSVEIVEIKPPGHAFVAADFERMHLYFKKIEKFLDENEHFQKKFPSVNITLVCDKIQLGGVNETAYASLEKDKKLVRKTWVDLLSDTKEANKDFLKERDRLIKTESRHGRRGD